MVLRMSDMTKKFTYKEICDAAFNSRIISSIVEIVNILFSYGGPVGYLGIKKY
jgi:hypothetical protein